MHSYHKLSWCVHGSALNYHQWYHLPSSTTVKDSTHLQPNPDHPAEISAVMTDDRAASSLRLWDHSVHPHHHPHTLLKYLGSTCYTLQVQKSHWFALCCPLCNFLCFFHSTPFGLPLHPSHEYLIWCVYTADVYFLLDYYSILVA